MRAIRSWRSGKLARAPARRTTWSTWKCGTAHLNTKACSGTFSRHQVAASAAKVEAIFYLRRLWAIFLDDLRNPENELPEQLRAGQQVFGRTGGLHAAGLFNAAGELLAVREDIGRHNAVDKIVGWALLEGLLPLRTHVLMVSGRGGFEIMQKALAAGIPVVASVSAPSSLAVKLARELNLTLVGFLRGRRFVVYAGQSRCLPGGR